MRTSEKEQSFKVKSNQYCQKEYKQLKQRLSQKFLIPLLQNDLLSLNAQKNSEMIQVDEQKYFLRDNQKIINVRWTLDDLYKRGLMLKVNCQQK